MKYSLTVAVLVYLIGLVCLGQTEFDATLHTNYQFVEEDAGYNFEGSISYHINQQVALGAYAAYAQIYSPILENNYDLNKGGLQLTYRFNRDSNLRVESVIGICWVAFDDRLQLTKDEGGGLDIGARLAWRTFKKVNFGAQVINTYTQVSPGAITTAGLFLRYELK
ncbi:hypothetical protein [Nonlabens xiamenensis]|uniref:hypothetical protein n=1 Tax=Nonlabens xiamenensis TaxID=2341043 RepID=UPI000F60EDCB|nr:hypothetical protein [Nonlabens xiamenensis]